MFYFSVSFPSVPRIFKLSVQNQDWFKSYVVQYLEYKSIGYYE